MRLGCPREGPKRALGGSGLHAGGPHREGAGPSRALGLQLPHVPEGACFLPGDTPCLDCRVNSCECKKKCRNIRGKKVRTCLTPETGVPFLPGGRRPSLGAAGSLLGLGVGWYPGGPAVGGPWGGALPVATGSCWLAHRPWFLEGVARVRGWQNGQDEGHSVELWGWASMQGLWGPWRRECGTRCGVGTGVGARQVSGRGVSVPDTPSVACVLFGPYVRPGLYPPCLPYPPGSVGKRGHTHIPVQKDRCPHAPQHS